MTTISENSTLQLINTLTYDTGQILDVFDLNGVVAVINTPFTQENQIDLVSIPFENEKTFKNLIREIAQEVTTFLVIQDWDFHGFGIPVNVIVDLFEEIDVFKSLKVEVTPAGKKYSDVLEATGGRLHISGGWASSQMTEALDRVYRLNK